jgi:hypothetical protein
MTPTQIRDGVTPARRAQVLQHRDVQGLFSDDALQAGVFLLERLQALRLVFLQRAVLRAPPIKRLV